MRKVVYVCLGIVLLACLALVVFLLHDPKEKETWSTLAALLAVIAAVVAILPALRVLEIQEDALRPRPTPYFDLTSRYDLLQLRVKNLGAGVACGRALELMHRLDCLRRVSICGGWL